MHLVKYVFGFLVASVIQAMIVILSETFKISQLGANFTLGQLLTHVFVGQVFGFILLFIVNKLHLLRYSYWSIGIVYGLITWIILLTINVNLNKINNPFTQGLGTIVPTSIAFIIYGVIVSKTIKDLS